MKITKNQLRRIIKEALQESDSASIQKELDALYQKYSKTDDDYVKIDELEGMLDAKLGRRKRSRGVAYNPYDY